MPIQYQPGQVHVTTSPSKIAGLIRENTGPKSGRVFSLSNQYPQQAYITGVSAKVLVSGKPEPSAQQYLFLTTLNFASVARHTKLQPSEWPYQQVIVALNGENLNFQLPAGSGIAAKSNEQLHLDVAWYSRDIYLKEKDVSLEMTVEYSTKPDIRAVHPWMVTSLSLVNGTQPYPNEINPDARLLGQGCLRAEAIVGCPTWTDSLGQIFQPQFPCPAGRAQNWTQVGHQLPHPAKVVYAQPFATPEVEEGRLVNVGGDPIFWWKKGAKDAGKALELGTSDELISDSKQRLEITTHNPASGPRIAFGGAVVYCTPKK